MDRDESMGLGGTPLLDKPWQTPTCGRVTLHCRDPDRPSHLGRRTGCPGCHQPLVGLIGEILCISRREQRNEYHTHLEINFQAGYIQDQPRFVSIQSTTVEFKPTSTNINGLGIRRRGKDLKSTVKFADVAGLEQAKAGCADAGWIRCGAKRWRCFEVGDRCALDMFKISNRLNTGFQWGTGQIPTITKKTWEWKQELEGERVGFLLLTVNSCLDNGRIYGMGEYWSLAKPHSGHEIAGEVFQYHILTTDPVL